MYVIRLPTKWPLYAYHRVHGILVLHKGVAQKPGYQYGLKEADRIYVGGESMWLWAGPCELSAAVVEVLREN